MRDLVAFDDDGPHHAPLFESDRVWSEIVCIQGPQGLGPISDRDSDAICVVLAGRIAVQVDRGRTKLEQWGSVLVPRTAELTVRNASDEPAVILLVAAPPPVPRAVTG